MMSESLTGLEPLLLGKFRFEVLTAVIMESSVFCDITPCSLLKICLLHAGFFPDLFFGPEDGGDMFL
jgi:hypothetical protein